MRYALTIVAVLLGATFAHETLSLRTAIAAGLIVGSVAIVITAQQFLLNNERLAAQLQGQWLLTSVFLIKALGGDWQGSTDLASGL